MPSANGAASRRQPIAEPGLYDLDAAAAAVLAEARPFEFTFRGENFSIPAQVTWPLETLAKIGTGDIETALSELLGEAEYQRLIRAGAQVAHLNALMDGMAANSGVDLPNSSRRQPPASART
jgi:hypothetical protein